MDRWYLASKNDGLFIINAPPHPSTDDIDHDCDGPDLVLNVTELPEAKARAIVGAHNKMTEQMRERDGNATIELVCDDGNDPFARVPLTVVDFDAADNTYVVE